MRTVIRFSDGILHSNYYDVHVLQAQILNEGAGLLGYCRVVVAQWSERRQLRSGALGSIPSGYPCIFYSVCFYPDLPPVAYHQFLPPVVVYQYSYKNNHVHVYCKYLANLKPCSIIYSLKPQLFDASAWKHVH